MGAIGKTTMQSPPRTTVYIDPSTHHFLGGRLFDGRTNPLSGEQILAPYLRVRDRLSSLGIAVHTADRMEREPPGETDIYISLGILSRYPQVARRPNTRLSAFVAMECPAVEPSLFRALPAVARAFKRVLSWSDTEALLPFTGEPVPVQRFQWPQSFDEVREEYWGRGSRDFLVMINANKLPQLYHHELYTKRLEAVAFFHQFGEIALYGKNWDRMPSRVGRSWMPYTLWLGMRVLWEAKQGVWPNRLYAAAAAASRGPASSKHEVMSQYRFAICFENQILKGWITEKLFDCLFVGTVPVYWGAPDIDEWVPRECFVGMRQFGSFADLRKFLHSLAPVDIDRYRRAGREYLASKRFRPFHVDTFAELFERIVREDAGLNG